MKTITYKGIQYELDSEYFTGDSVNNSVDFQLLQLKTCIAQKDFITLESRINNMLKWGGIKQKENDNI